VGELLEPGLSVSLYRRAPIRKPRRARAVRNDKMASLSSHVVGVQFLVIIAYVIKDARITVIAELIQKNPTGTFVFCRNMNEATAGTKTPMTTGKRSRSMFGSSPDRGRCASARMRDRHKRYVSSAKRGTERRHFIF